MTDISIAVVCITHDSADLVAEFARAMQAGLAGMNARVVMVDSGSTDASVRMTRLHMPEAEIHELDGNRGYSAGINAGIRKVRQSGGADVFVIMNPDVRIRPDTLGPLLAALRDPAVGIAVPQVRDEHGALYHSLRRAPSIPTTWCDAILGGPLAGRLRLPSEVYWDPRTYGSDRPVVWATGCLMAITTECLRRTGDWDESFFLYEEEVDYALRAADQGFTIRYVAESLITRILGERRVAPWAQSLMHTNRVALVRKRSPGIRPFLVRAGLLTGDLVRTLLRRPEAAAALWTLWHGAGPAEVMRRFNPSSRAVFVGTDAVERS